MKMILCAAAYIAVAGTAVAQTTNNSNGSKSTAMTSKAQMTGEAAAISALEARWTAALIAKDNASLGELLAPEFQLVGIRSTGAAAMHRAEWLARVGSITFYDFRTKTTSVQLFGDAALATVEGYWDIVFGSQAIKEHFYVTDVWIHRDRRWRVVRRHSSPYQTATPASAAQPMVMPARAARGAPALAAGELFRTVVQIWQTGEFTRFDDLISRDYVGHVSSGDRDREGLRRRILAFRQLYTALRFSVEDQFISGDRVATRMLVRGKTAKGEPVTLMGINIASVRDGKLQEEWNTWEPLKDAGTG